MYGVCAKPCQAVCFLQVISLGGLRGRLFRQSNWVVVFRIIWKRKGTGDKNITVTRPSLSQPGLTCNYLGIGEKRGDIKEVFIIE